VGLSSKQIDFIATSAEGLHLAWGSVRSGKTYASLIRFLSFLIDEALDRTSILVTAKKKEVIERNIFDEFKKSSLKKK